MAYQPYRPGMMTPASGPSGAMDLVSMATTAPPSAAAPTPGSGKGFGSTMQKAADRNVFDALAMGFNNMSTRPNPSINRMAMLNMMQRRQAAKQEQQANRTAEWLESQGASEYAQMARQGFAGEAMRAYQADRSGNADFANQVRLKVLEAQLRDNGQDPTADMQNFEYWKSLPEGAEKDALGRQLGFVGDDSALTESENKLRGEILKLPQVENAGLIQSAYNQVSSFYENPGAVSDYALAVAFAKILDPESVVREGEVSAVANNGSLADNIKTQVTSALRGTGKLPPEVRNEIASLAGNIYSQRKSSMESALEPYKGIAQRQGLNWENINVIPEMPDPTPVQTNSGLTVPFDLLNRIDPAVMARWPEMSDEQRRKLLEELSNAAQ